MAARPTITVWDAKGESAGSLPLPAVFTAPIRLDVVQQVHSESLSAFEGVMKTVGEPAGLLQRSYRVGAVEWSSRRSLSPLTLE